MGENAIDQEHDAHEAIDSESNVPAKAEEPHDEPLSRQELTERWTEVISTVLLAIVAVATAWSGYQSTRWSGVQADNYVQASGARVESDRAATLAGQQKLYDLVLFNNWLNAYSTNQTALAGEYEKRFRDEFRPIFKTWLATNPFTNPDAPAGPLLMPEYHVQLSDKADKLAQDAETFVQAARAANQTGDDYVFVTVFLAVTLFFVAIAERFDWTVIKWVVLALALGMLILGISRLATLPIN